MFYKLEIENFYSIRDRQVIDLTARQDAEESFRLVKFGKEPKLQIPKVVALFGANASGKSNVLKAVSFLMWFITGSFGLSPNNRLPFTSFLNKSAQSEPTCLAMEFAGPTDPSLIGEPEGIFCRYAYEVVFSGAQGNLVSVISESLKYWPLGSKRPVYLFHRDEYGKVEAHEKFGMSEYQASLDKVLRSNVSVLSTLFQLKHSLSMRFLKIMGSLSTNIFTDKSDWPDVAVAHHCSNDPTFLPALNKEIERVDFGISKFVVEASARGPIISAHHNGLSSPVNWAAESNGTRQFVRIFPIITQALANGSVAVIDELDQSIHPYVLQEILQWFYDPQRNHSNAQLWMSCQNPSLLRDLVKEEIFLCDKDSKGRTSVYGLNDIQKVRRNENFYSKYLSGIYGAVPSIG